MSGPTGTNHPNGPGLPIPTWDEPASERRLRLASVLAVKGRVVAQGRFCPPSSAVPVVLCPVLVARAAERVALAARIRDGGVSAVVGEAGIGKSRLVSVLRLFSALGGRLPVVLVIEDLRWANPETLAVLAYIKMGHALGRRPHLALDAILPAALPSPHPTSIFDVGLLPVSRGEDRCPKGRGSHRRLPGKPQAQDRFG